jgi:outer membrane protein
MNKIFLFLVCLYFLAGNMFAQRQLSAKDAVKIALEKNYNIQIAENQEEIAKLNNKWSEAGMFPTVALTAAFNNGIQDNSKNPFTFTPGIILNQGFSPVLSANWNIFSGFAVWITKERLELLESQSAGNSMLIIENTIQDVLKAYYSAVLQQERLNLFSQLLQTSSKRLKYAELKEKYSASNSLEILQFRNQYYTDSSNKLLQEINYHNTLRNLLILMNESDEINFSGNFPVLTDKLNVDLMSLDEKETFNDLLSSNQNLKNQYINWELQKSSVELQKSFLYPTLSLQAGITPAYNWLRNLEDENMKFETQTLNYYANLNLRYNVFNNWKTKRAVEVAKIQEKIAELNVQSMEKTMQSTLTGLLELYKLRSQLVNISEENLVYAEKMWQLTQKRYELGSVNSIELASIQNTYQNTLIQHYENLYNRMDTFLEIYKMTGKIGLMVK